MTVLKLYMNMVKYFLFKNDPGKMTLTISQLIPRPKTAAPILQTSKRCQSATRKAVTFEDTEREFRATKIAFTPESPPIKAADSNND